MVGIRSQATPIPNTPDDCLTLVVYTTDGSRIDYEVADLPVVKFEGNDMVVSAHEVATAFPLSTVDRIVYEKSSNGNGSNIVVGIDIPENDTPKSKRPFIISREQLVFGSLAVGTDVTLFSSDGRMIAAHRASGQTPVMIPLENLVPGVYLVTVSSSTYKIVLR